MTDDRKDTDAQASDSGLVVVETSTEEEDLPDRIEEPAKLLRIASMTRSMLEEVRTATLDEEGRARLKAVFDATLEQLHTVLTEDLRE